MNCISPPFFTVGKPIKKVISEGNSRLDNKGVPRRRVGIKGCLLCLVSLPTSQIIICKGSSFFNLLKHFPIQYPITLSFFWNSFVVFNYVLYHQPLPPKHLIKVPPALSDTPKDPGPLAFINTCPYFRSYIYWKNSHYAKKEKIGL